VPCESGRNYSACGAIERSGYSRRSQHRYRKTWEHLIEFSFRKGLGDQFSGELAVRFLEEYRVTGDEIDMSGQGWRKHVVWGVRALADFAETGRIDRAFTDVEAIQRICRKSAFPGMQRSRGLGAGTRRQAFGGGGPQFGERKTRLRHSPIGLRIGIACGRHSYLETGSASLGGFKSPMLMK
jgi:hypothetical protein